MFKTMIHTALAVAAIGAAAPVHAQSNCATRDVVVARLADGFGEGLAGGGLRSENQVIEVWASPETGSWTVLLTRADGVSCVMASGTDWHQQEPKLAMMGSES